MKNIILLHNGRISVESKTGEGTTFCIWLPLHSTEKHQATSTYKIRKEENKSALADKMESLIKKKKTILILEDNIDMQEILTSILDPYYNVILCFNGKEALKILEITHKPDLIIADIMMPVMDGREFYRHMRREKYLTSIPVIFLTARAIEEEKIESLSEGAIDYIYKPFNFEELLLKVNNFLKREDTLLDRMKEKVIHALDTELTDNRESFPARHLLEKYNITERESDVLLLLKQGLQYKEIADKLDVSLSTVNTHIQNMYKKTGVQNRVELLNKLFTYE